MDLSSGQAEDYFIADVGSYFAPEISGYDNTSTHADFGCNISPWHSSLTVASIKDITRFARCGTKSMPGGFAVLKFYRRTNLTRRKKMSARNRGPTRSSPGRARGASPGLRFLCVSRIGRSEEHTSELQSRLHLVCRLLLEKKKTI